MTPSRLSRKVQAHGRSVPGRRPANEDRIFVGEVRAGAPLVLAVADGMGGHDAGEIAAGIAVEAVADFGALLARRRSSRLDPQEVREGLEAAFAAAHDQIRRQSEPEASRAMGTTLVAAVLWEGGLVVAHTGDSRAYLRSGDGLRCLTEDHSKVGELIRAGEMTEEDSAHSPIRHILTHALGPSLRVDFFPEEGAFEPAAGPFDVLLSSDGLHGAVPDEALQGALAEGLSVEETTEALVSLALESGSRDNVSVVVARGSWGGGPRRSRVRGKTLLGAAMLAGLALLAGLGLFLRGELPGALFSGEEPAGSPETLARDEAPLGDPGRVDEEDPAAPGRAETPGSEPTASDLPGAGARGDASHPWDLRVGFGQEQFVWIEPGTFQMGSASGVSNERPVHEVRITRGFWLQKTEVTQGQWRAVMGTNPSHFSSCGDRCPVERVSWNDIQEFLRRLNQRDPGKGYRLPTEAEWEYACRAGTTGEYGGTGRLDEMGWYGGNSWSWTRPVGQKRPNAWGLYDMHGNVWEWVRDWAGSDGPGPVTEPSVPTPGTQRVLRGGSWSSALDDARSDSRLSAGAATRDNRFGFRLVRAR